MKQPEEKDAIIAAMKAHGAPLTRENYLRYAYLGKPPASLTPEEEEALPARFQKAYPTHEEQVAEQRAKEEGKDGTKNNGGKNPYGLIQ